MNEYAVIVGGGAIGQALTNKLLSGSDENVLLISDEPIYIDASFSERFQFVNCRVDHQTNWLLLMRDCQRISSVTFTIPACASRDEKKSATVVGHTSAFIENIGSINLALLNLIEEVAPKLTSNSQIVGVSSVLGRRIALADASLDYHASKSVLEAIFRYLSVRLAPHTTCNLVAPGLMTRDESSALLTDAELRQKVSQSTPLERPGTTDEVAQACFLLATGCLPYLTGQILTLDGGGSLMEPFSLAKR